MGLLDPPYNPPMIEAIQKVIRDRKTGKAILFVFFKHLLKGLRK